MQAVQMRQTGKRAVLGAMALALLALLAGSAWAHGSAPAITQRLGADAVRLSNGLGVRQADGTWQYVCPTRWQGGADARVVHAPGQPFWVLDVGGVWRGTADGRDFTPVPLAGAVALTLRAGHPHALVQTPAGGAELWQLDTDPPQRLWADAGAWTTLAGDATHVWLAGGRGAELAVAQVDATGHAEVRALPVSGDTSGPRIVAVAGRVFVALETDVVVALGEIDPTGWHLLGQATPAVRGPIVVDGQVLFAQGGALRTLSAGVAQVTDSTRYFTDVGVDPDTAWTAARQDIRAVDGAGKSGAVLLDLAALTPPTLVGLDGAAADACWTAWTHLAVDGGLVVGERPPSATPPATPPAVGCNATSHGSSVFWLAAAVGFLVVRRRGGGGGGRRGAWREAWG